MNARDEIAVGDKVAVLIRIPKSGGRMRWVEASVLQVANTIGVVADGKVMRYALDTWEQIGGRCDSRGPSRIELITDELRERINADAVWYSEYMRKEKSLEYLRKVDWYSMSASDVETIAEMAAILSPGAGQESHEQGTHWQVAHGPRPT